MQASKLADGMRTFPGAVFLGLIAKYGAISISSLQNIEEVGPGCFEQAISKIACDTCRIKYPLTCAAELPHDIAGNTTDSTVCRLQRHTGGASWRGTSPFCAPELRAAACCTTASAHHLPQPSGSTANNPQPNPYTAATATPYANTHAPRRPKQQPPAGNGAACSWNTAAAKQRPLPSSALITRASRSCADEWADTAGGRQPHAAHAALLKASVLQGCWEHAVIHPYA